MSKTVILPVGGKTKTFSGIEVVSDIEAIKSALLSADMKPDVINIKSTGTPGEYDLTFKHGFFIGTAVVRTVK